MTNTITVYKTGEGKTWFLYWNQSNSIDHANHKVINVNDEELHELTYCAIEDLNKKLLDILDS